MIKLTMSIFCCMLIASSYTQAGENADQAFKWKDMRAACKDNHESDACKQMRSQAREFCQAHPDTMRCRKMQAMKACRDNPESEQCQQYKARMKQHCEKHPESKKCVRARIHKICKDNPDSEQCLAAKQKARDHFCEKHPKHEKCT